MIPGNLLTEYSGFYAQDRPGWTCRKRMETGRMFTAGSADAIPYHFWCHSGLQTCSAVDRWVPGRIPSGRPGL